MSRLSIHLWMWLNRGLWNFTQHSLENLSFKKDDYVGNILYNTSVVSRYISKQYENII
jgi:hypothetical protein